jgi:hypothetical protein
VTKAVFENRSEINSRNNNSRGNLLSTNLTNLSLISEYENLSNRKKKIEKKKKKKERKKKCI